MVYGKQDLCMHDGILCWQHARSSGKIDLKSSVIMHYVRKMRMFQIGVYPKEMTY